MRQGALHRLGKIIAVDHDLAALVKQGMARTYHHHKPCTTACLGNVEPHDGPLNVRTTSARLLIVVSVRCYCWIKSNKHNWLLAGFTRSAKGRSARMDRLGSRLVSRRAFLSATTAGLTSVLIAA